MSVQQILARSFGNEIPLQAQLQEQGCQVPVILHSSCEALGRHYLNDNDEALYIRVYMLGPSLLLYLQQL